MPASNVCHNLDHQSSVGSRLSRGTAPTRFAQARSSGQDREAFITWYDAVPPPSTIMTGSAGAYASTLSPRSTHCGVSCWRGREHRIEQRWTALPFPLSALCTQPEKPCSWVSRPLWDLDPARTAAAGPKRIVGYTSCGRAGRR